MKCLAKIIKVEKISKQFWRYTFLDIQNDREGQFIITYPIRYTHGLVGKLELSLDEKGQFWLYQGFNQNIADLREVAEEKDLGLWEEKFEKKITGLESEITRKPIKFFKVHEELVEFLNGLHKTDKKWEETAKRFKKTDRTLRRWREKPTKHLQKAGPKFKIDRKSFYHLIYSFQTEKAKTLREASKYVADETGLKLSIQTIHRILKKIKYSHQVIHYRNPNQKHNLAKTVEFLEEVSKLPQHLILATDESGYPLNLAPKKGWGPRGQKITRFNKHYATNYSLILVVHNVEKGGIICWELFKNAVNTEVFANFLTNLKLPTEEKHYLLMDNISFHKSVKVEEVIKSKNIEPKYIVAANPWLNPTELVFNVLKNYVRSKEPKTEEELRKFISEKVNELQGEDLRKYFKDCLDFDFILKSGH
ncbi:MAG: transposase [Mycoplasmataceae bacterium RV_VA103A]|nr:MAG: transposase [Mycoplasmataceae bacterium RV_VA103A]